MTGYSKEESIGKNCRFLQGEGTDKLSLMKLSEAIKNGETISIELINYKKDGTEFWNELLSIQLKTLVERLNSLLAYRETLQSK